MPRTKKTPPIVDITREQLSQLLSRVEPVVTPEDYLVIRQILESHTYVQELLRKSNTTLARLRRLFGVQRSEKTCDVVPAQPPTPSADNAPVADGSSAGKDSASTPAGGAPAVKKRKGHGRIAASDYTAAKHVFIAHQSLHPGDPCPKCYKGKLYEIEPSVFIRITGCPPLNATKGEAQRLRCSTCNVVFTAKLPAELQGPKFDETASSMIAFLHYNGMPFVRLARVQANMKTPVPASTQWEVIRDSAKVFEPVCDELTWLAAQGSILHNDDTCARILSLMGKRRAELVIKGELPNPDRKGLFTTALVSKVPNIGNIVLFRTGRKHAGENLDDLLELRDPDLPPPTLMCDALDRNVPKNHAVVQSNCIVHGRRNVVYEVGNYPTQCQHLLEQIRLVYKLDADCKHKGLSDAERLLAHQEHSGPVMNALQPWMQSLLDEKTVEPNCDFGKALNYFLKRWDKFTVFLRVPGAPLDNNICERALKSPLNSRKASLFFRTVKGAFVGDMYMTLIYNTMLHHENTLEYLTALQRHEKEVAERPGDWLPWNYRDTLSRLAATT